MYSYVCDVYVKYVCVFVYYVNMYVHFVVVSVSVNCHLNTIF